MFALKGIDSEFMIDCGLNGIPAFILIDPKGKIISHDTYRPSSEMAIRKMFQIIGVK